MTKINAFACASLAILMLASCAKPVAKFTADKDSDTIPSKVKFTNQSKKAETYLWDFGDGNTSTESNPEHKYVLSGNYTVSLTVKKGDKESKTEQAYFFEAPHDCYLQMETSLGSMTIKLFDETPQHRDNIVKLAESEFYDGLLFHRVINGFMIQGGDPNSKGAQKSKRLGSGGPGYTVPAEFDGKHYHVKGALAAARLGDAANPQKNSSGSQFYIVQGRAVTDSQLDNFQLQKGIKYTPEVREAYLKMGGTPFLDQEYTVYGQVIEGMDVIDKIAKVQTETGDRPSDDVKIIKIRVVK